MLQSAVLSRARFGLWRPKSGLVERLIEAERGHFALWLPVFMIGGVVFYFALPFEPPVWAGPSVLAACFGLLAAAWRGGVFARAVPGVLLAAAVGFAAAAWQTERLPPMPVLPHGAVIVRGEVRSVELLPLGRRLVIAGARLGPGAEPLKRVVRLRLRNTDPAKIAAGDEVSVRALIFPPFWPPYPGGWDLQRAAYFEDLAGYGFALGPASVTAHAQVTGWDAFWLALRGAIAERIETVLPGANGAIAATLLTGEGTAIPPPLRSAFAAAGLAHILAVAGLHMGIVMGLILVLVRVGLAASEYTALRWPAKEIAALAALGGGGIYMLLTGEHLPIERSFVMATLVVLALLAGRRPISLRGLALAAAGLILISPADVVGVSFQMSFAAVLALIAGYDALRPVLAPLHQEGSWRRKLARYVGALAITSFLAGTAALPFGAYHFGHVQPYYVAANLIAVPLTALWIMPFGLLALALMPFGLAGLALQPMGWGIGVMAALARAVASWPAATIAVPPMPDWGLAAVALGMAWLGLWRSRWRLFGLAALTAGLASPLAWRAPDLLVSPHARLIAARVGGQVYLERLGGSSRLVREEWQRVIGSGPYPPLPSDGEAGGGQLRCAGGVCRLVPFPGAAPVLLVLAGAAPPADCTGVALVVSPAPLRHACPNVPHIDRFTVWRNGAVSVWLSRGGIRIISDRSARGDRPWVPPDPWLGKVRRKGFVQRIGQAEIPKNA